MVKVVKKSRFFLRFEINEIRLKHFRAFENSVLHLSDLTVLVGRNGAGKTTLMEAIDFVRDALNDSLLNALERRGGLKAIRQRSTKTVPDVSVAIVATFDKIQFLYGFTIGQNGRGDDSVLVKEEVLTSNRPSIHGFVRTNNKIEFSKNSISQAIDSQGLVLPMLAPSNKYFMQLWRHLCSMRTYNPSPELIRQDWQVGDRSYLLKDARNAADVLHSVQNDKAYQGWIVSHLEEITPGIENVYTETTESARRVIYFDQIGSDHRKHTFAANLMSDGTLRAPAILLALKQKKPPPSLIFIDEIEDSIHPAAMSVLIDALLESSKSSQVIFTSHNTDALNHKAVTGERVRILDWQNGVSKIFRLRDEVIERIDPPESVGRLLRTNSLWKSEGDDLVPNSQFFKIQ
ncbi:MAG: AAA family ATPase [Candidatus Melainabacteria bacterium]|nr:AAA family ATPase [Candidatus Melainabacteria bacterium]